MRVPGTAMERVAELALRGSSEEGSAATRTVCHWVSPALGREEIVQRHGHHRRRVGAGEVRRLLRSPPVARNPIHALLAHVDLRLALLSKGKELVRGWNVVVVASKGRAAPHRRERVREAGRPVLVDVFIDVVHVDG